MESIIVSSSLTSYVPSPSSIPLRTNTSICQLQNSTSCFTISKQQKQKKTTQLFLRPQNRRREVTARRFSIACGVTEINETQFSETVLKSVRPVLVEFVASWCGPCRLISPAIEWVAQEYKDKLTVVKIDHDANPRLIEQYKVYGLPALILFKSGQEIPESRREGAITKVKLKEYLDALLESISVV